MVSYVGFAGTVTSIILSVLAIVYTYLQNSTSITHLQRLAEVSDRLCEGVDQVKTAGTDIAATISRVDEIRDKMYEVNNRVVALSGQMDSSGISETQPDRTLDEIKNSLKPISVVGFIVLYLCIHQCEKPKNKSFSQLLTDAGMVKKYKEDLIVNYSWGLLVGYKSTGIVNASNLKKDEIMTVSIPQIELFKEAYAFAVSSIEHDSERPPKSFSTITHQMGKIDQLYATDD